MTDVRRETEARLGAVERVWGPRSLRAQGGAGDGRRQIDLRGLGGLAVTVEPDQFLDLGEAFWRGEAVSFTAPSTSARAESWGRRWLGGLFTTCGLTAVGRAEPADGGMHGRAHLVPALVTRSEGRWNGDSYELEVAGSMREGGIFEQNLQVRRTITARHGESRVRVSDVVRNDGFAEVPLKLLYHINLGWPLVDEGARVRASTAPEWQAALAAPTPLEPEKVDALVAAAGDDGYATATLDAAGTRVTVRYRVAELPYLTVWRSAASGSYALGIEPGTCWPSHADGPDSGKAGRMLAPGEEITTDVEIVFEERPPA